MNTGTRTKNDPAATAIAPGHGSISNLGDMRMNENTDTTEHGCAAMGCHAAPETEQPWAKARRLGKELSLTLAECDGNGWMACILPDGFEFAVAFKAINNDPEAGPEHAVDKVHRLSFELAEAMEDWFAITGTKFVAHVTAPSLSTPVWFKNVRFDEVTS